jgi:uncharacterized membrane protein (UPF0127 family)
MNKVGWPWVGTTQHEMGSMSESFKETDQSANIYDTFTPDVSVSGGNPPSIEYSEGRVSPVEGDGADLKSEDTQAEIFAKDSSIHNIFISKAKESIEVKINNVTYICNIANSLNDKMAGLQVYEKLEKNQGLLFPYKKPEDVLYHMGSVSFPIDIIFIGDNNKIKKISKDIQPGTLATFGASNVKYVLEIFGGESDRNSIKPGDTVSLGDKKISKTAGMPYSKEYTVYNFDSLIKENSNIDVYKIESFNEDSIAIDIYNRVISAGKRINIPVYKIGSYINEYTVLNSSKSLNGFMKNSKDLYNLYKYIRSSLKNKNNKVIFTTEFENYEHVLKVVLARFENLYGKFPNHNIYYAKIASNYNHLNIIDDIHFYSPKSKISIISSDDMTKKAGQEISNVIKNKAKSLLPKLDDIEKIAFKSLDNMQHNMTEYEKIATDKNAIQNSQGQFHQSIKKNAKIVKEYLILIRDVIKELDEIKDATTTMLIIDSLAGSARSCSESVQSIFDLVNSLNENNILNLMKEKTENYEAAIDDLSATIERAKKYINENILGILILSY